MRQKGERGMKIIDRYEGERREREGVIRFMNE